MEGDQPEGGASEGPAEPPEHPLVASLRDDPAGAATPTVTVTGLFGRSDDPAKRRVYFSAQLDHYAEFLAEDVIRYESVSAGQSPVPGHEATRVTLTQGSRVDFTYARTESVIADDQFDLDIRIGEGTCAPTSATGTGPGMIVYRTMVSQYTCVTCHLCR
jgi:hypothetical protein